ncbi:hypothetical protein ABIB40_003987 [Pedobacter sp. UYP30]
MDDNGLSLSISYLLNLLRCDNCFVRNRVFALIPVPLTIKPTTKRYELQFKKVFY